MVDDVRAAMAATLANIRQEIGPEVTLVAVSKQATLLQMQLAHDLGIRHFAENRVQDALAKQQQLPSAWQQAGGPEAVCWHLIGHLQSNKVAKVPGHFEWVHSIDSVRLARLVALEAQQARAPLKILLQVNISGEATKHGFEPEALVEAMPTLLALPVVEVCGLMTMAPAQADEPLQRQVFQGLASLRNQLQRDFSHPLPVLSMGMSRDYRQAVACGATMVRLGTVLFGPTDDVSNKSNTGR
ncbi:MAG: YggS family pyridoxal phosphate-dependent enzyme [Candidatus Melainabacteria bacterium]|nr:YggS family pyridoxal phosphate-dependent enzyme [Candidatus Melainabacteria bacterium]